jgi:glycosyltransferase involved in cell wall biosynthesis
MTAVNRASIVIPAHNESALIEGCLSRILESSTSAEWEIVVVCNGCSDDTADRARTFKGVQVVETERAGKMPALNLGDEVASVFPRLYVDADAVVDGAALRALADRLGDANAVRVGSPRMRVDCSRSTRPVAAYFSVWSQLRYAREAIGSGVYGVSAAARRRFGAFPERGGDDQLIYRLFDSSERVITDPSFGYVAPRTVRALISSRARMFALNTELERTVDLPPPENLGWRAQGLERLLVDRPRDLPAVALFMTVQVVVKIWGRRLARKESIPWNQDRSSRGSSPT